MPEYIEKEETIQRYQNVVDIIGIVESKDRERQFGLVKDLDVIEFLQSLPAANVRENVKGEWIEQKFTDKDGEEYVGSLLCSKCGLFINPCKVNFCPNCGTDMTGGNDG